MKRIIGRLAAGSVFLSLFLSNAFSANPGLVAYWSFDEASGTTLADISGNGNTAYINSATRVAGFKGNALSFNGSTGYAYTMNPEAFLIENNQFSIECWANARQTDPVSGSSQTFVRNERAYCLGIGTGGKIGFQVCDRGTPAYYGSWTFSNQALQANTWSHVAATWDGKRMRVFINGAMDRCDSAQLTVTSGINNVYLGKFVESSYEAFNGVLDEVKIYNYALTADSILMHFYASTAKAPVTLIPCSPNPTFNRQPVFTWYKNDSIHVYGIQISQDLHFSTPFISVLTSDTAYTPSVKMPYGIFYWWVCNADVEPLVWTTVSSVEIQDPSVPVCIPRLPQNPSTSPVSFRRNGNGISVSCFMEKAGSITLDIYGTNGGRVWTARHGASAPGPHTLVWDGKGAPGRSLPEGSYCAVCRINGTMFAKRIVLTR